MKQRVNNRRQAPQNRIKPKASLAKNLNGTLNPTEQAVEDLVQPITTKMGLELVSVEYCKEGADWYLRIFIDRSEGIDHGICEALSSQIDPLLDEADFIPQAYYLEVSSPGIERPLKKEADFRRYQGNKIRITTFAPIGGQKIFIGILQSVESEAIQIGVESVREPVCIPFKQISSARLAFDF